MGQGPPREEPVLNPEVIMPGDRRPDAAAREEIERTVQLLALLTDNLFRLPGGWRVGLDPIIGLFPVLGDLVSAVVSLYVMQAARQLDLPRSTVARMGLNVAIDYVVGSIPILGNLFDFWWKANYRNLLLLQRALASPKRERRRNKLADWFFIGGVLLVLAAVFIGSVAAAVLIANWVVGLFA